ncbi:developmental pluripotency-associated protein 3 isoform X2 [Tupaia chinensis]|uniref:developmental pluripotency-associated protein 3 isoform X2 n=1 Tax=Tupaia chinensis TaxID=246437 RepID=UPI0003C8F5A3|nr:developmental pluripotency-associated protein 3 isoform X2 [Tupaia chinensis]
MDPPEKLNPTLTPGSSPMSTEENSQEHPGAAFPVSPPGRAPLLQQLPIPDVATEAGPLVASPPACSETLLSELRKLTLNPRTGLLSPGSARSLRQGRRGDIFQEMGDGFPYRRKGVRTLFSVRKERMVKLRYLLINKFSRNEPRSEPFRCRCSYCVYHGWDPSENAKIGSTNDPESI